MRMLRDFKRGDLLVSERLNRMYLVLSLDSIGDMLSLSSSGSKLFGYLRIVNIENGREERLPPNYFDAVVWQVVREET